MIFGTLYSIIMFLYHTDKQMIKNSQSHVFAENVQQTFKFVTHKSRSIIMYRWSNGTHLSSSNLS